MTGYKQRHGEYSEAEIDTVFRMYEVEGGSWKAIARHLGRTNGSKIANRYNRRKAELEAAADADRRALLALHRRCMRCPAWILSEHAGHRMCEACREDGDDTGTRRLARYCCAGTWDGLEAAGGSAA